MSGTLANKSIVITGGASGIGAAAAILGGARGALVTIADLNESDGRAVADRIVAAGGRARFVRTDISNEDDVRALVQDAVVSHGGLHGAFNNAGVPPLSHKPDGPGPTLLADLPVEAMRRAIEINVLGTFFCLKHQIAAMLGTGGGSIVNTASAAGILAVAAASDYVTSKHGVVGLTKAAAIDYAADGIRVNAIVPGVIDTPMVAATFDGDPTMKNWAADMQPNKRLGRAEEVAEAALWLLSDAASLVTGIAMPVDGGYSMV